MKKSILMLALVSVALALAAVLVLGRSDGNATKAVNVGGASNSCQCSKRLER